MLDIKGYEGQYAITSCGRVWSYKSEKFITQHDNGRGYLVVDLCKDGKRTHHYVHRLVAEAYIANHNKLPQVNHKDEDKTNNSVNNLEWCTNIYNQEYGTRKDRQAKTISIPVYCLELDKTFSSYAEAAKYLNISPSYISYALATPNKHKGYHFSLVSNSSTTKAFNNNK